MALNHRQVALSGVISFLLISTQSVKAHDHGVRNRKKPVSTQNSLEYKSLTKPEIDSQGDRSKSLKYRQSPGKTAFETVVDFILAPFYRKVKPAISRGGVCAIAPGLLETENHIASRRPLFMWRGEVDTLTVYDYESDAVVWQSSVAPEVRSLRYGGSTELEAGKSYIWSLARNNQPQIRLEFSVMSAAEQDQLRIDKERGSHRSLPVNLADASYFADLGLWSDMLTSLSLSNLQSVETEIASLEAYLCSSTASSNTPT